RLRKLIRERRNLLELLRVVPRSTSGGLGLVMLLVSLLPALTAVAVAWLVGRVVGATDGGTVGGTAWPLATVAVLLTIDQVAQSMLTPYRNWMAARVNGAIRQTVRRAVSARPGIEHLESQVVRDAAALPVENAYLFNLGAGAEGQLWLLARFAGAVAAAAVVARYSPLAAMAAFGFVVWQRSILRRHYAGAIASGMVDTIADGRAAAYWSELLSTPAGAKEVRVFGFRPWALERFHDHGRRPVEELTKVMFGAHRLHVIVFALNALSVGVPFALIAREAINGNLGPVGLTAALGGTVAVARVLSAMGFEAFSIEAAVPQLAAVERLRAFATEEDSRAAGRQPAGDRLQPVPTIKFDRVTFTYPGTDVPVLRELDLVLEPGRSVAIVGENGAGKTTLLKLLCGFYRPTSGRILIDGCDLAEIDPCAWRRRLAVIFQDFTRFELDAFENIALAAPNHPDARAHARAAAVAAGADHLVDGLPRGWDTILSRAFSDGAELSGGQWQRVALARALYAARVGGTVLVLDEPTASLDVDAEVALFDQLLAHATGCTAIVVSHRFSTVRRADRIVVIVDGCVAEDGAHADLMALGGRYARLFDLQATRFRDGANVVSDDELRPATNAVGLEVTS
ncbi:MAG: ABC transporter ATP-binding protein, partial [Aquihabitans sp.]